mmetsp:Transcript_58178/g.67055  ORF Transcript_58178/g.67055 Transcript_58178/m.67055 type:complete len:549 (+) Transcript_58178:3-1649(+)
MIKINRLTICVVLVLFALSRAQKHSNVDYLSFGYDLILGNPHSTTGVDPGFKFDRIFDLTYTNGAKSSDGRWEIPDNVTMARTDACTLNFQSTEISGMESYQQSLEVEVTVKAELPGVASFKASTDFKSMEKSTTTTSDKHIYSTAVCDVYRAKSNAYNPPRLHSDFINALKTLPLNYDEGQYMEFLDNYGTHAVTEINMGARYGMMSTISERTYDQFRSESLTVTVAASATIYGISGGVDTRTSNEKEWANKYSSAMTSYKMIAVGAKPVAGGDAVAWANQAIEEPMPLRYTLIPLSELMKPIYVRGSLEESHMNTLKANFDRASKNYCGNYLKPRGIVASCEKPADIKPQPSINSCKWCANGCGGDFPADGGHALNDQGWQNWVYTFPQGCSESPYTNNRINSGAHLCCQNVDSANKGQCRICSSCGGSFSAYAGAVQVDQGWDQFFSAYDNSCQGSPRARGNPGGGLKICCQDDPICSLCSSCGGTWPHENGVLGADQNWPDFFSGRGHSCSGDIGRNDANRGMKWCCKTKGTSFMRDFLELFDV